MNILEQLKQLEADATPGPLILETREDGYGDLDYEVTSQDGNTCLLDSEHYYPTAPSLADAKLFVALRNAWPKLLAVVEAASDGAITWDLDSASVYGEKRIFAARYKLEVALDALKEDE